ASGLPIGSRAAAFGAYLLAPALLLVGPVTAPRRPPVHELAAVLLFWLPVEFLLLPPLPVPVPGGFDVARFTGLADALYLFLAVRRLPGVGLTFALRWRDVGVAVAAFLLFAAVALPLGFATRFIAWGPRVSASAVI